MDLDTGVVTSVQGRRLSMLTPTESALLTFLASKDEFVVSRAELLSTVWGYRAGARTRTVSTTVARLRAKIEDPSSDTLHLQTIHGQGLRLVGVADDLGESPPVAARAKAERWLETEGLVAIVGPPGVGKTHLVHQLAAERAPVWVTTALPSVRPEADLVVVDSLVLDAAAWSLLRRWARSGPVVVVDAQCVPTDVARVRLKPLGRADARRLLTALAERRARPLSPASVAQLVDQVDGLPAQLVACAVQGGGPPRSLRTSPLQASLDVRGATLLPPVRQAALDIAAFEGRPAVEDLRAIGSSAGPGELAQLESIGWIDLEGGRAAMLRGVRESLVPSGAESPERLVPWACSLEHRVLVDGVDSLAPVASDVGRALAAASTATDAEIIAGVWRDLALLVGPVDAFLPALAAAADRFPESERLALRLALLRGRVAALRDEDREAWANSDAVEAHFLRLMQSSVAGADPVALREAAADRVERGAPEFKGRFLPQLYARLEPEEYRSRTRPLRDHAASKGWDFVVAHVDRFELETLVRHGQYADALAQVQRWPTGALLGADAAYFLGLAALLTGRSDEARVHFRAMRERRPADAAFAELFDGLVAFAERDDGAARDKLLRAANGTLPRGAPSELLVIVLRELGERGVRRSTHVDLEALTHGALPEDAPHALPARVLWHALRERRAGRTPDA